MNSVDSPSGELPLEDQFDESAEFNESTEFDESTLNEFIEIDEKIKKICTTKRIKAPHELVKKRIELANKIAKEVRFYSINTEYGCFSNFIRHLIEHDGFNWLTTEHYFQAQKHNVDLFPADSLSESEIKSHQARFTAIRDAKTPSAAAALGRKRDLPIVPNWDEISLQIMLDAILMKAEQHSDFKEKLLSTGNLPIIEDTGSSADYIWGCGGNGTGKNLLGRALMDAREILSKS